MSSSSKEKLLAVGDGLVLAYEDCGTDTSCIVVLFFHGMFGVGMASKLAPALEERHVHYVALTLPGWGNSSPVPKGTTYVDYLYKVVTVLLHHLHPLTRDELMLYIAGGSFGTVISQILYGAPYDKFPLGRQIVAMMLIAPFSPIHSHKEHNQCLKFSSSLMIGSPAPYIPFKLVPRVAAGAFKHQIDTRPKARTFIRDFMLEQMGPKEAVAFERWKQQKGYNDGEELDELAEGVHRSTEKSWEGFMSVPSVFHSGWGGYDPRNLDEEHAKPVFFVLMKEDKETLLMGEWLAGQLKKSTVRYEEGGHAASLFVIDAIWADFMGRYA